MSREVSSGSVRAATEPLPSTFWAGLLNCFLILKASLFCAGTFFDPDRQEVITRAQGELNLKAEGLQMFRNAIDYLLEREFTDRMHELATQRLREKTHALREVVDCIKSLREQGIHVSLELIQKLEKAASDLLEGNIAENCQNLI